MSARELSEWMAYDRIDPFGEERGDLRAGILASLLANINRDRKKKSDPFSPLDFMPVVQRNQEIDRAYDQARKPNPGVAQQVRGIFGAMAGRKKRGGRTL